MPGNFNKLAAILSVAVLLSSPVAGEQGQIIGKHIFGLTMDFQNDPVLVNGRSIIHQQADNTAEINLDGVSFSVSSFAGDIGSVYLTRKDQKTGEAINTLPIDSSKVNGITQPSGGIESGWGTLLYGESSLVNSVSSDDFVESFKPYFKNRKEMVNPYHYGYPFEVVLLDSQENSKLIKNYAAGRVFASHLLAMPDGKTVYLLDSRHSGNLYAFIAKEANSMSNGSLYVASSSANVLQFQPLGKTTGLKAKFNLKKTSFKKLFTKGKRTGDNCEADYQYIDTVFGKECLKIKDKRYSGILEPLRVSALLGVKPLFKDATELYLDTAKNAVVFKLSSGQTRSYSFDPQNETGSNYLLRNLL